jgi:hypothetical protein
METKHKVLCDTIFMNSYLQIYGTRDNPHFLFGDIEKLMKIKNDFSVSSYNQCRYLASNGKKPTGTILVAKKDVLKMLVNVESESLKRILTSEFNYLFANLDSIISEWRARKGLDVVYKTYILIGCVDFIGNEVKVFGNIANPIFLVNDLGEWGIFHKYLGYIVSSENVIEGFVEKDDNLTTFVTLDGLKHAFKKKHFSNKEYKKAFKSEFSIFIKQIRDIK